MNTGTIKWVRFTWNLESAPLELPVPEGKYEIRVAERAERDKVGQVIHSSFAMDSEWARFGRQTQGILEQTLERSFTPKQPECLVLVHGPRIIGASLLDPQPDQPTNLPSGPCVLIEYRSRGLGSFLLGKSLESLASRGLLKASAITPAESIAARYVYTKFGGTAKSYSFTNSENEE